MTSINAKIRFPGGFAAQFNKGVRDEIRKVVVARMPNVVENSKPEISKLIIALIKASDTYSAITGGLLQGEVGLLDVSKVDDILEIWSRSFEVKYLKSRGLGRIRIGVILSDYSDVLTDPSASFSYESKRGGGVLDWLRWLLLEGTQTIVSDYDFKLSPGRGRTGFGFMVKRSGGWSVPDQHAGSESDNFVTRALANIEAPLEMIFQREMQKVF